MCTCLIAGKKASATGSVLLAANDDWDNVPGVLTHAPRMRHSPGDTQLLVSGKAIPQVAETCGYVYTACKYDIGILDRSWAGGVNDRGVAVAGTGVNAFKSIPSDGAWLEPDDVPLLILMRASTARQGIALIGELVDKYGFTLSGLPGYESAACFGVADAEEGWWLEITCGGHWAAIRVPDDEASVRVNAFGSHDVDLTDKQNVMASPGLADFARSQGWWDGDERHFDFAAAFGSDRSPNEWGPELDPMNMRRRWRAVSLFAGRDTPEDDPIYSVRPARPLTIDDMTAVLRDVYEDTVYDLTKVPTAVPYGDPFHDSPPDYSLCRWGTVASFAAQLRRNGPPVMWTCMGTPRMGFYIPLYVDVDRLPACCEQTRACVPGEPSLFWAYKELAYMICRRYSKNIPLVEEARIRYELDGAHALAEQDRALVSLPERERRAAMTGFSARWIEKALRLCQELRVELEYRY